MYANANIYIHVLLFNLQVLGFSVSYTDFPKKGEYLSLVSLSTNPPQVMNKRKYKSNFDWFLLEIFA